MVCRRTVESIIEPPSATQLEIIRKDTNEISEEKLKHNEKLMYEWIRCQSHFPKDIDRGFLRAFLRGSKHNLDTAKRKLEHHLAARHLYPEIYHNRSPLVKEIIQAMDVVSIAPLPKLTSNGLRLIYLKLHRYDLAEFNISSVVKLFFMLYELLISSDGPFAGDIAIFDATYFGAGHAAKWFGPFFRVLATVLKEAYAMRLKQIHIINAPSIVTRATNVVKPLMHPKVRDNVYINSNHNALLDFFGLDYLPADYNGNLKSVRSIATDWYDILNDSADWFENQEHVKITTIPKKVNKSLSYFNENIGLEGSFRKLEID